MAETAGLISGCLLADFGVKKMPPKLGYLSCLVAILCAASGLFRIPQYPPAFLTLFFWSPTKIDYRKELVPTYSNLSTGGPSCRNEELVPALAMPCMGRVCIGITRTSCAAGRSKSPHSRGAFLPKRGAANPRVLLLRCTKLG